jgi:hypothetical protein
MSMVDDVLKGLSNGPSIHDWRHANKIFVGNAYQLLPKYSYLFHVSFDINSALSRMPNDEKLHLGMLVKSVQLPKFTIDTKTMNAYNRPNIVQTKLKYDTVQISFHDDSNDSVRDFWYDYMSHYYRDSDYSPALYEQPTKYNLQQTEHWGYQPAKYATNGSIERVLNYIKIYSLHQKRFTEYILVNPTITSFQHGQHQQGQSDFLENTMTVSYETVLYNYGTVLYGGEPDGFATLSYDKTPSPLTPEGGGTTSILGPGGLLSTATGIAQNLAPSANGDINPLGVLRSGVAGLRAFNKLKGQNLLGMAGAELKTIGQGILQGDTNTLNRLALPKPAAAGTNSIVQSAE